MAPRINKDLTNRADPNGLALLDGNPNKGDLTRIAHSLRRYGQQKPVVIDTNGTVIAGNHTVMAARQLGWTQIAVTTADTLTQPETLAYSLMDNAAARAGNDDQDLLDAMLETLADIDPDLIEDTGHGDTWDPDGLWKPANVNYGDDPKEHDIIDTNHQCPSCGFGW